MLGKKSWNVYNTDNIARVRRDEAAAEAAEEAEEQRMQEIDAQRRLATLRGEAPPPVDTAQDEGESGDVARHTGASRNDYEGGARRKRKRNGEDDTDFELRLARDRNEAPKKMAGDVRRQSSSAPIVDRTGHINLFGDERSRAHAEKNDEAEKEARKKKREYEDQYTMRFSNAAGREGLARPWYSQQDMVAALGEAPSKDVWGNQDPRRKAREAQRLVANDPLAMMKRGAAKVREVKQERKRLQDEREEELRRLEKEDGRRGRERERRRRDREHGHGHRSPAGQSEVRRSRHGNDRAEEGHSKRRRREDERPRRHESPCPARRPRRHET